MTVVLATVCQDGVVLGTASQNKDKAPGKTYPAEKLHPLGELAAWGGSGARSVLYDALPEQKSGPIAATQSKLSLLRRLDNLHRISL